MTDELLDPIEEAKFSRRSLLVRGGLTAAGLTALGAAPTVAFGANRRATDTIRFAVVTHGDTGSFWSVFKKGVDQATSDLKAPRDEHHAGLRQQRRREAGRRNQRGDRATTRT